VPVNGITKKFLAGLQYAVLKSRDPEKQKDLDICLCLKSQQYDTPDEVSMIRVSGKDLLYNSSISDGNCETGGSRLFIGSYNIF